MKEWFEKFLCKYIAHKKIICYDGMTKGLSQVCIRLQCNYKKSIPSTKRNLKKYNRQLGGKND